MPDAPFQTCPTCGTPKVDGSHALVIYFANERERDDLATIIKAELPNATPYPVRSDSEFWQGYADKLLGQNNRLRAVVAEWLPIVQRQLDGLLIAAEAQDGAKSLYESAAWKAATERVDRMRTALDQSSVSEQPPEPES